MEKEDENERPIKQNNFNPNKWDEEDGNIGDLAVNPHSNINIEENVSIKEQWRTTCNIKFYEPKLPDNEPPRIDIKPYYVFGYRAKDAHNNIKYIDNDNIIYCAGKLGIIQNLSNNGQKYFINHKNEISALCINKNKSIIATGEDNSNNEYNDEENMVRIWDALTLEEKGNIKISYNQVKALSFSFDDKYLVCCCSDEKQVVLLIDVKKKEIKNEVFASEKKILGLAFIDNREFATVGISHYKYWIINDNKLIFREYTNSLENFDDKLGVISVIGENFVTGSSLGYITLWQKQINIKMKKCHNSQIDSLYSDDKLILSGARDRTITILDKDLTILHKIDLKKIFDPKIYMNCGSKSIDIIKYNEIKDIKKILIGTHSGDILELIFKKNILNDSDSDITYKIYNNSHFCENSSEIIEITSINYSRKSNLFITTGTDNTIRFWEPKEKKQKHIIKLEEDSRISCSTFSINENIFIIGFDNGNINIYSGKDFSFIDQIKERKNKINVIKCSKDELIACATKDERGNNIIDVYFQSLNKYCTLQGAQNNIDGMDWSEDSKYLVTFSHEKECRIFSLIDKFMISEYSIIDNYEWNTWTLGYGWPLKGYYDGKYGNIPIYITERFKLDNEIIYFIATGDINGSIKLFKFPISNKEQKAVTNYNYHVRTINNIRYGNPYNKFILFTSGSDGCLIAWEMIII